MKKRLFILSFLAISLSVLASPPRFSKDLRTLTAWMVGDFDNGAQAGRDTSVQYFEVHVVRIWENLYTDAIWIYEEIVDSRKLTVSQRIYRFSDAQEDVFEAIIYDLADMKRYTGEYKQTRPFDALDPESDLTGLMECSIYFRKKGKTKFSGASIGKECGYGKKNAKYVTSVIDVYEDRLIRADRGIGWDEEVVWGPALTDKGTQFRRSVPEDLKKKK